MSAPTHRCRTAGRGLVEQRLGGASMTEFPDIIKVPIRPRVFVSYHWGVREPQQEAKPPDGRARLARGLEVLLRQEAKPPQAETIVPASPPPRRQRKPRHLPPDRLKTAAQAAAKLGCSVKTLGGHIASGALKYVAIGHGTKRPRKMFADPDLNEFIANQTRKDSLACPSTRTRARRTGNLTSSGEVIAFTAQPRPRPGGKRRR